MKSRSECDGERRNTTTRQCSESSHDERHQMASDCVSEREHERNDFKHGSSESSNNGPSGRRLDD